LQEPKIISSRLSGSKASDRRVFVGNATSASQQPRTTSFSLKDAPRVSGRRAKSSWYKRRSCHSGVYRVPLGRRGKVRRHTPTLDTKCITKRSRRIVDAGVDVLTGQGEGLPNSNGSSSSSRMDQIAKPRPCLFCNPVTRMNIAPTLVCSLCRHTLLRLGQQ
jgi:hypothetical protein